MRPNEKVFWISVIANFVWPESQFFALENHKWINPYHDVVSLREQKRGWYWFLRLVSTHEKVC